MSPIKDLTDSVRLPRLGKIHLGFRDPAKKGAPTKTDYFVFPKDHSDYKKLVEVFGERPKELRILIPVEDKEAWATQYYKAYNQTYGLVCKGDGEIALRMIDVKTRDLPDKDMSGTVELREITCDGKECLEYKTKKCHEVMNFRFILPEVPGLGVWQIDTGSINSILNINSCAKIIKRAFGCISLVPLKLTFEPIPVNNPETGKKQTVYVLNLRTEVTMAQLADAAREQAKAFMLEAPDLEVIYEGEVEKGIDEIWGEVKPQKEEVPETPEPEAKAEQAPEEELSTEGPDHVTEQIAETSQPEPQPVEEKNDFIDMDWLKESLKTLQDKKLKAWTESNLLSYMKTSYKVEAKTVLEGATKLDKGQAAHFVKRIQDTLEIA